MISPVVIGLCIPLAVHLAWGLYIHRHPIAPPIPAPSLRERVAAWGKGPDFAAYLQVGSKRYAFSTLSGGALPIFDVFGSQKIYVHREGAWVLTAAFPDGARCLVPLAPQSDWAFEEGGPVLVHPGEVPDFESIQDFMSWCDQNVTDPDVNGFLYARYGKGLPGETRVGVMAFQFPEVPA